MIPTINTMAFSPGLYYAQSLMAAKRPGLSASESLDLDNADTAMLGVVAVIALVGLGASMAIGYYVGKEFGRPKTGAVAGGLFGVPGMAAVSLLGKAKK